MSSPPLRIGSLLILRHLSNSTAIKHADFLFTPVLRNGNGRMKHRDVGMNLEVSRKDLESLV